ncbi:MAG: hypothetical protein H6736_02670 [Alphaproteobacteria bacterium]|nr:hypothetical protein [Alphaproteobacteria bacterium]MCB9690696.1 hypothetical protein [Alphaproteobacteria bacterium]
MLTLTTALLTGTALATEKAAEECVQTKVWDAYAEGWGVRTLTSTTLQPGKTRNYLVTLYAGNEYRIETCGDEAVTNLDVLLYDTEGNVLVRDQTDDRQPSFTYKPESTSTFYVVVYLRGVKEKSTDAGVGMAVVYK